MKITSDTAYISDAFRVGLQLAIPSADKLTAEGIAERLSLEFQGEIVIRNDNNSTAATILDY